MLCFIMLCYEFRKGVKPGSSPITLGWPGFIGHFPLVVELACNKYHIRALYPFLDFLAGVFRVSQKQARKIASPLAMKDWLTTKYRFQGPRSLWSAAGVGQG